MKRTINKPKKKSHKKKLEIKKNSKPLNKTKKDERNLTEVINKRYNSLIFIVIILYVVILGVPLPSVTYFCIKRVLLWLLKKQ